MQSSLARFSFWGHDPDCSAIGSCPQKLPPRAAYCDIDGTITATNILLPLHWFKRRFSKPLAFYFWQCNLLWRAPWWGLLDKIDRSASNRSIYSHYAGLPAAEAKQLAGLCFKEYFHPRLFPVVVEELAILRQQGVKIVLVTGGLDFIARPIAEFLQADLIAPALREKDGLFTGALATPPLTGAAKAAALSEHSQAHGIDLSQSYAFGDAYPDLPMLEAVGNPVAVNPDSRLKRIAQARHWRILKT
jgi:HAD superfamily hydrolase (TIGR01490 family)